MKSQKISANPLTMYKTRNRVDKKAKIIKTPHFHLIEKLELPLEDPIWCPTTVKAGQSISIKGMVEYLNIAPAIDRKAVLLIRAYDDAGNEVEIQLDKMFRSEAFGAYFIYLPSTQSKVTELYTFVVPEGVTTIHFGFSKFLCSDNEQVVVSDLTIYPQAVAQLSKIIETASNHVIEKLELPLEDPVWYPTTVKPGQSISIKARVDYLNIAPAIDRKAVLLIRAYDESGEEVNVQLDKTFRSEAFGAYFIYLPSTQNEVTELYTFVVPEDVSMIHFGFSRFLCADNEQVVVSDLTIYPQAVVQSPRSTDLLRTHYVEKLELPLEKEEPIWYPTLVQSGQVISIKALVDYLNIDLTNNRKAVLLIRSYDETGNEVDVQLDKTFKSEAFGAYFIYLPSTQSEVTDLYTFVVPEGISTIHFGFTRFLCSDDEQVLVSNLTIQPQAVMVNDDIAAIIKAQDEYQEAYEKLVKFRESIETEINRFLEEIKSVSELNLVTSTLLHNTKGIIHTANTRIVDKKNKELKDKGFEKNEPRRKYVDIENNFPRISYDYGSKLWPKKAKDVKLISVLDEISEVSWSEEFQLSRLNRNKFIEQIQIAFSNGLFLESCWKGNQGEWEYAFTSPGLKHQNARDLLKAIDLSKAKGIPVLFWNKEDPMHYEKFLPIAEKCDIVFTTDVNKIEDYKKDLGHDRVFVLPFAANPYVCNPQGRYLYTEENLCFAGSYYSVGHDHRKQQMDELLPCLLECNGVIYDRMSKLNNERYLFPKQYQSIVRDSVSFKEMTALYKHFKIFLNINTITDSPTMMSRRVYELLACGTPVISTPSLALEKQFPGIVQIANDADEAKVIVEDLLSNPLKYARLAHLGYREVMLKHTYENRSRIIEKAMNIKVNNKSSLVSIIICTCRSNLISRIVENVSRQNHDNIELIFVLQDYTKQEKSTLKELINAKAKNIKKVEYLEINDKSVSLGMRLNKAFDISKGNYIAKMDDDDFYFENYLTDMLIPFKFGDYALVGKKEVFMYLEAEDKVIRRYPNQKHQNTGFVAGPTLVIKREVLESIKFEDRNTGEDSSLIKNILDKGLKIYSSDPFNFIQFRGKNHKHTWKITEAEILSGKQTEVVYDYYCEDFIRF
ncbi:glycosyltransferase family protein [Psychrobacter sp. 1Y11]|uniref:glycosyltransferase family protein n=1 Tax=Psychrobacter sp. 1Y11 TaxID=3457446 RepID=UPI003FD45333